VIERHYGARVRIFVGDDGGAIVVPVRASEAATVGGGLR
jgi:hypothetical protein